MDLMSIAMFHKNGWPLLMLEQKIGLGTVQFGQNYGVANESGQLSIHECSLILNEAFSHGINTIDTAIGYGESETVLGRLNLEGWDIISKLPRLPESEFGGATSWVADQVAASLDRLRVGSLYGILLHCPDQLFSPDGKDIYQSLIRLKEMGYVKKIGVSIYSPDELDKIFQEMQFDIVQAPLSILDRRLIHSGWLARLSEANVEIHVRSIFLQGLLLMSNDKRPLKFDRWQSIWSEWNYWLLENNLTPLQACLVYALSINEVDRVVVGLDSVLHLREILSLVSRKKINLPNWPETIDIELLNPAKWNAI